MFSLPRWSMLIALLLYTFLNIQSTYANDRCAIPNNLKTWDYYAQSSIRKGRDWKSNESTDYWKLVYSWSPTFCARKGNSAKQLAQCRQDFGLIVHGLWAQKSGTTNIRRHPRNCVDAPAVSKRILEDNFCLMPDVKLMQKEWEKHGTCDFKNPEEYFNAIQMLNKKIRMPDKQTVLSLESKSARELSQWLVDNNQGNGLSHEHINIRKSGRNLKEISVCFDKQFELRSCNEKGSFKKQPYQNEYKKYPDRDHEYDQKKHNSDDRSHERSQKNQYQHRDNTSNTHDEAKSNEPTSDNIRLPIWKSVLLVIVNALLGVINS
ncbi:MAG: hypothetical protein AAGF06_03815 [Pseudomonadota bacterium]